MAQPKQQAISFGEIDRATLGMYIALVLIGWLMIFAVNFKPGSPAKARASSSFLWCCALP
jgi:hypothetical protein